MRRALFFVLFTLISYKGAGQNMFCHDNQFILQESDKQWHYKMGMFTGAVGYAVAYKVYDNKYYAMGSSVICSLGAGLFKEFYDALGYGSVESRDILATTMGGVTISVTIPLTHRKR